MIQLKVEGAGHSYGYRQIFRGIDLELFSGNVLAITGANGSGKSTFLKILAGILQPTEGKIKLALAEYIVPWELHALHVGLVAPYVNVYEDLTLRENLSFIAKARSLNNKHMQIESTVEHVGLTSHIDEPVKTYSTGMQQRVRLAAAMFHEPEVLLLDEPTLSLDSEGKEIFGNIVAGAKQVKHLVVIASNSDDEIAMADQSLCIENYAPRIKRFA